MNMYIKKMILSEKMFHRFYAEICKMIFSKRISFTNEDLLYTPNDVMKLFDNFFSLEILQSFVDNSFFVNDKHVLRRVFDDEYDFTILTNYNVKICYNFDRENYVYITHFE